MKNCEMRNQILGAIVTGLLLNPALAAENQIIIEEAEVSDSSSSAVTVEQNRKELVLAALAERLENYHKYYESCSIGVDLSNLAQNQDKPMQKYPTPSWVASENSQLKMPFGIKAALEIDNYDCLLPQSEFAPEYLSMSVSAPPAKPYLTPYTDQDYEDMYAREIHAIESKYGMTHLDGVNAGLVRSKVLFHRMAYYAMLHTLQKYDAFWNLITLHEKDAEISQTIISDQSSLLQKKKQLDQVNSTLKSLSPEINRITYDLALLKMLDSKLSNLGKSFEKWFALPIYKNQLEVNKNLNEIFSLLRAFKIPVWQRSLSEIIALKKQFSLSPVLLARARMNPRYQMHRLMTSYNYDFNKLMQIRNVSRQRIEPLLRTQRQLSLETSALSSRIASLQNQVLPALHAEIDSILPAEEARIGKMLNAHRAFMGGVWDIYFAFSAAEVFFQRVGDYTNNALGIAHFNLQISTQLSRDEELRLGKQHKRLTLIMEKYFWPRSQKIVSKKLLNSKNFPLMTATDDSYAFALALSQLVDESSSSGPKNWIEYFESLYPQQQGTSSLSVLTPGIVWTDGLGAAAWANLENSFKPFEEAILSGDYEKFRTEKGLLPMDLLFTYKR